jgi:hypothetical protein
MLTPDQLPLSRHLPLPLPLDCADVEPPDPVSWCSVVAHGKGKSVGCTSFTFSFSDSSLYLVTFV